MKSFLTAVLMLLVALLAACSGNADAAAGQAWWQAVLSVVVDIAVALAVPCIIVLVWLINKKWGIGLERKDIEWVIESAVGYGEQMAKKALKSGEPLEGNAVLAEALKHGEELLSKTGLADKWGDKLADLIEAKLGTDARVDAINPATVEGLLSSGDGE